MERVVFEADPLYSVKASDDSDFAWDMLLPVSQAKSATSWVFN